jgi:hypothetical protein
VYIELLLKHAVDDLIPDGYDEAVLLLDETAVDFAEVGVALIAHVGTRGVGEPLVHRELVVEGHYLGKQLVDGLFGDLLLEVAHHLDETVPH